MEACSSFTETVSNYNVEMFIDALQIFNI